MAVTKRECYQDAVVNYTTFPLTGTDVQRKEMRDLLYSYYYPELTDKTVKYRKIGRLDSVLCLFDEMNYYNYLIEYLIIFATELGECYTREEFEALYDTYNFDCIRNMLRCNYNNNELFDKFLYDILGITFELPGIGLMIIGEPECNAFTVYE